MFIGVKMKKTNRLRGGGRTEKDEKTKEAREHTESWNPMNLSKRTLIHVYFVLVT